ncbi:hypothetical protein VSR01_27915 [Actinacidiphila sp. DG2A-62]|uniref:hypothetical protein n=1 Tax=Actinacidiphila sp. DG2A-62 TaxID=3108821 RepID=UPI002DB9CBD5|nr:hypothetical protein [Actinacidiphila sp. DG2A-62]MEC3997120.1 hypothetical protein [Actinacidiphila sp. DG2A-62]
MQKIPDAVVNFPTVAFTAVLVHVSAFWVFVLITRPGWESRHLTGALKREDIKLMRAASAVLVLSGIFSLAGSLLLHSVDCAAPLHTVLDLLLLIASVALGFLATRMAAWAWRHARGDAG